MHARASGAPECETPGVTVSAAQAAAFYRELAKHRSAWTIRDRVGYPAPLNAEGRRAQPFWSTRSRTERIIANVVAYRDFEPVEISLADFRRKWLPDLARDGLFAGLNWSGPRATGYDIEPETVMWRIDQLDVALER
jgi:hypothetical protein